MRTVLLIGGPGDGKEIVCGDSRIQYPYSGADGEGVAAYHVRRVRVMGVYRFVADFIELE